MARIAASLLISCTAALAFAAPVRAQSPVVGASSPAPASCPPLLRQQFPRLQDEKPQALCQYAGKVLLVVNTASYCGFTHQYKGLEELYGRYGGRGLVVLGFPSNDFAQEGGSNQEIADFCENTFGVRFPMFAKSSVRGTAANPLFRELAAKTGKAPAWNFHKYLVARDGTVVGHYSSFTGPLDRELVAEVERQLARKP